MALTIETLNGINKTRSYSKGWEAGKCCKPSLENSEIAAFFLQKIKALKNNNYKSQSKIIELDHILRVKYDMEKEKSAKETIFFKDMCSNDNRKLCDILEDLLCSDSELDWKVSGIREKMSEEKLLANKMINSVTSVQKVCRATNWRELMKATIVIQRYARGFIARKRTHETRRINAVIRIQSNVRMWLVKRRAIQLRKSEAAAVIQRYFRVFIARKRAHEKRRIKAVKLIQSNVRKWLACKRYCYTIGKKIILENYAEGWKGGKRFRFALEESQRIDVMMQEYKELKKENNEKRIKIKELTDQLTQQEVRGKGTKLFEDMCSNDKQRLCDILEDLLCSDSELDWKVSEVWKKMDQKKRLSSRTLNNVLFVQNVRHGYVDRSRTTNLCKSKATIVIQSFARGFIARRRTQKTRQINAVVQIQSNGQMWITKRYCSDIFEPVQILDYRVDQQKEIERETTRENRKFCENEKWNVTFKKEVLDAYHKLIEKKNSV